jgi:hypothetical protein
MMSLNKAQLEAYAEMHGGNKKVQKILVEKYEEKKPHGRHSFICKDDIKMFFKDTGCGVRSALKYLEAGSNIGLLKAHQRVPDFLNN